MTAARTFREAIHAQPENLKAAAAAFHDAVEEIDIAALCSGTLVFSGIGATLEAVAPGFGCVVFGGEREQSLAVELASFGATVALLSDAPDGGVSDAATIELAPVPQLAAPILQILPVQLLVDRVAALRGLEIGKLRRQQDDTKVAWWGPNRPE